MEKRKKTSKKDRDPPADPKVSVVTQLAMKNKPAKHKLVEVDPNLEEEDEAEVNSKEASSNIPGRKP